MRDRRDEASSRGVFQVKVIYSENENEIKSKREKEIWRDGRKAIKEQKIGIWSNWATVDVGSSYSGAVNVCQDKQPVKLSPT